MRTIEDMIFSIERQRAGLARNGLPPAIVSVEESLAEDGATIVIVGLATDDDGGVVHIASSFDLESIIDIDKQAVMDAALQELTRLFDEAPPAGV